MQSRVVRWPVIAIIGLVLLCLFVGSMTNNTRLARAASNQNNELTGALRQEQQKVSDLQNAIQNVGSDSYIEVAARSTLDYMKPGELRFEVVNSEQLGNYTPQELQIIAEEMAQPDR